MDIKSSNIIYLLRHGQTDWNKRSFIQGRTDIPLNDYGKKQIRNISKKLAVNPHTNRLTIGVGVTLTRIYSSPLKRAIQSAEIVRSNLKTPIQQDERLMEISYGLWEGKTRAEVEKIDKERFSLWLRDPAKVSPPDGESLFDVVRRIKYFVEDKKSILLRGNTLIVCHSMPFILLSLFLQDLNTDINSHSFMEAFRLKWKNIPCPGEYRKFHMN